MATAARAFAADWRDPFGNSFDQLVEYVVCGIVNAEPERMEYPSEMYSPLVVKAAVQRLEECRRRPLAAKPLALPISISEFEAQLDVKLGAVVGLMTEMERLLSAEDSRDCDVRKRAGFQSAADVLAGNEPAATPKSADRRFLHVQNVLRMITETK